MEHDSGIGSPYFSGRQLSTNDNYTQCAQRHMVGMVLRATMAAFGIHSCVTFHFRPETWHSGINKQQLTHL